MRILTIPATNSRRGMNSELLTYVGTILEDEHDLDVEQLDLNDFEMAIYSPDREAAGLPGEAERFFAAIGSADAVIVSYAEYNGSFTPAWKNTYDWASRIDQRVYQGKPVVMLAASPGPRAGQGVLGAATMSAPFFGAELVGSLGVGRFNDTFDTDTESLVDVELDSQLRHLLGQLVAAITTGNDD